MGCVEVSHPIVSTPRQSPVQSGVAEIRAAEGLPRRWLSRCPRSRDRRPGPFLGRGFRDCNPKLGIGPIPTLTSVWTGLSPNAAGSIGPGCGWNAFQLCETNGWH
jgi:hypothetical protein